jgi:hypothetical protein
MSFRNLTSASLLTALFCSSSLFAGQVYYDRTSFNAASQNLTTLTFDAVTGGYTPPAVGSVLNISGMTGLTMEGVNIKHYIGASERGFYVVNASGSQPWYNWNSGATVRGDDAGPTGESRWVITLPIGITAIGIDLGLSDGTGSYTVRVNGSVLNGVSVAVGQRPLKGFFGYTSDVAINTIQFIAPNNVAPALDNLSFGAMAAAGGGTDPLPGGSDVPEASTMLMVATACVFLSRMRMRAA